MGNKLKVDFIKTSSDKIEDVKKDNPGAVIHLHNENEDNLYIGSCRITDNFNIGNKDDSIKTMSLGGLEASTLGELKNKSVSQILYEILCPTIRPTVKNQPSILLNYVGNDVTVSGANNLIEVGSKLPVKSDFATTANRGSFSDGTLYAGECGTIDITMTPNKFGENSEEGIYKYYAIGTFADGDIPKDSHENSIPELQFISKDVTSKTYKLVSVYPVLINDNDISVMSKHLVNYIDGETIYVTVPNEDEGEMTKFRLELPCEFSKVEVAQWDVLNGKYVDIEMQLIEGETYKYIRTNDVYDFQGSSKYEIRLKK